MERLRKAVAGLLIATFVMLHAVALAAPTSKLKNNLRVTGNLQVDGTSTLTGATTQTGNFTVGGNLAVTGTTTHTGAVTNSSTTTLTGVATGTAANVLTHAATSGLRILDTGGDHRISINATSDEAADRALSIPALGGAGTIGLSSHAQTWTGVQTFSSAPVLSTGTFTANGDTITVQDLGNANLVQSVGAQTIGGVKSFTSDPVVTSGGGAETFSPSGKIYHLITDVPTAADTTETDGATKSVSANTLNTDGATLRFKVWGTTANTANNKTVKLYWNGVAVFTSGTTSQNKDWVFYMDVIRTGSNTQKIVVNGVYNDAVVVPVTTTGSATDSGAIVIKNTMTNGTAAASDIVTEGATLEIIR